MRIVLVTCVLCLSFSVRSNAHGPHSHHSHEGNGSYGELIPTDKAIELFRSRVRGRDDYQNRSVLGRLLIRQARETGDNAGYQEAEKVLREACVANPGHFASRFALAETLSARHDFYGAIELLAALRKEQPDNPMVISSLGDAYLNVGQVDRADSLYQKACEQSDSAAVLARLAHVDQIRGQTESAIARMRHAVRQSEQAQLSEFERAWYAWRIGSIHWDQAKFEQSLDWFDRALQLVSDHIPASIGRAKSLAAMGRSDEAIAILRKILEQSDHPEVMTLMAKLYVQSGDTQQGVHWIRKASHAYSQRATSETEHFREHANFLANFGGDPSQSLALAMEDLKRRPDLYSHDAVAWALYRCGEFKKAVTHIDNALEHGTRDATLHFHAYKIKQAAGLESARQHLATCDQINPILRRWLEADGEMLQLALAGTHRDQGTNQ